MANNINSVENPNSALGILSNDCDPREFQNFMIYRETYIEEGICNYLRKNPSTNMWADKVITTEKFKEGEGHTLTKYVFHDAPAPQLNTNEMFKPFGRATEGTPNLNPSDPAYVEPVDNCAISCHQVDYGLEAKQWSIQRACLNTAWFCALDLQFNHQLRAILDAQADNLARISRSLKANWNRDKTMEYSTIIPAFPQFVSVIDGPKGVLPAIPAGGINPPHFAFLELIYDSLAIQYGEHAIGRTKGGAPLFGFLASRELNDTMRRSDADVRESDKYGDPTFYKDFSGEYIFHNFAFMTDVEAPRFVEDAERPGYLKRVWPYEQSNTTIGTRWDSKPGGAYHTAPYEGAIILFRDQFTNVPFQLNTRPGGGVQWDDVDFTGKVKWLRMPECDDPDGLKGRYKMQFIMGAKPGCHDAGLMFIFKRCGKEALLELLRECPVSPACPRSCDATPEAATFTCAESSGNLVLTATGSNTLTGVPEDTAAEDILYVTFEDGSTYAGEVVSYTDSTPGPESVTITIPGVTSCDFAGGVASVSSVAPCIPVRGNSVGLNGSNYTYVRFSLTGASALFDDTASTAYTATFGNDTTATGTLTGGPVTNEEGDVEYILQFSSNLSLTDLTTRDGIVCIRPA